MRIVFLVNRYWPSCGGVERYVAELAGALRDLGHEITVVAGAHDEGLRAEDKRDGITIRRFPALRSPARCWGALLRLRPVFAQAEVVHLCDTQMFDYFCRMLGWLVRPKRLFMTMHGMSCVYPVPPDESRRARRARQMVDGLVHDGAFIGKWLGVEPDLVAPQGLRPTADALPTVAEPDVPTACYVGRLEPDTGVALYLDAVDVLRRRWGIDLPLHVYGAGSLAESLRVVATGRDLPVTFHGAQPAAQDRLDEHTLAFVSGRMAIHEAMARRRAVVAAFVNPIRRDYVQAESFSPFIATGGDGAALAAAARSLLNSATHRQAVVAAAFEHVRSLSWARTAQAYLQLWTARRTEPLRQGGWVERARLAWTMRQEAIRSPDSAETREAWSDTGIKVCRS